MTNSGPRLALIAVAVAALALPQVADAQLTRLGSPEVSFTALGPGGLKINGTTSDLSIKDDGKLVTVVVTLTELTTGIGLRDKHLRDKTLDVQAFPKTELRVARDALHFPEAGRETSGETTGRMQLHGITKAVPFRYTAKREGDRIKVNGTTRVHIQDFGMEQPTYMGVTVKPDVEVTVRFDVADR